MEPLNRRRVLQLLGAAPLAAGFVWTEAEVVEAQRRTQQARTGARFKPSFFTAHEYATVVLLADMIIPRDERSGSASDAGVPEFIDFMMVDQPTRQVPIRGGLAWLDAECNSRFDRTFVAGIGVTPEDGEVVRSLIQLAHGLGLSVCAEGVETQATAGWLREAGCTCGQGYWLARPMPLEALQTCLLGAGSASGALPLVSTIDAAVTK